MMKRERGRMIQRELIRDIFLEYLECKRKFFGIAEACSVKGWPDRKSAILNAYKLQFLFNEREALRLAYLIESGGFDDTAWVSVSKISERLLQNWTDGDEKALLEQEVRYKAVAQEVSYTEAVLDKEALREPFDAAGRDPEYRAALGMVQQKIRELDARLASQCSDAVAAARWRDKL